MRLLGFVWACKVFLTLASAYKYCYDAPYSPVCHVSAAYAFVILLTVLYGFKGDSTVKQLNEQEEREIRLLEEGLREEFPTVTVKRSLLQTLFKLKRQ